jgi:hypothetical protein
MFGLEPSKLSQFNIFRKKVSPNASIVHQKPKKTCELTLSQVFLYLP